MTNQELVVMRLFEAPLGAVEGLGQTLERLEAYVAGRTRG